MDLQSAVNKTLATAAAAKTVKEHMEEKKPKISPEEKAKASTEDKGYEKIKLKPFINENIDTQSAEPGQVNQMDLYPAYKQWNNTYSRQNDIERAKQARANYMLEKEAIAQRKDLLLKRYQEMQNKKKGGALNG